MKHSIKSILKDGITIADVLANLRERERKTQNGVTPVQQGKMIAELFPKIYEGAIKKAEDALAGMALLPGSSSLHFIGNPVKWHENIFDYDEYTYQLNRMDHWRTLAEAYSFTGDARYARKLVEEFHHWIADCPCQPLTDANGRLAVEDFDGCTCNQGIWRALEAGIRMYRTWPHLIHHLIDSEFLDEAFLEAYLCSAYEHAQILYTISPKLWPLADHNHYLMENNGLLYLSCMFPELREAEAWKAHAIGELERSMVAQVTAGGGQIEGCASYHNGCTYWLALPILLSKRYDFEMSQSYQKRLRLMVEYSAHATRPFGGNCGWGDCNPYGGSLAAAAVSCYLAFEETTAMESSTYYYSYERLVQELSHHIWEVSNLKELCAQLARIQNIQVPLTGSTISWQKDLKQVFMRTNWSKDAMYLMFACRTPIQNLHAHIDPCGFELTAFGTPLLGDPGIYHYKDDSKRRHLKSAHWHNCLTLNHENPWKYIASWEYGPQQPGDILHVEKTDRLIYSVAEHENYRPTLHKRAVALIDERFLLVLDLLTEVQADTSVQINFHMDSPLAMMSSEASFVRTLSDGANVAVYTDSDLKPTLVPAKISTKNDAWHDSVIARFGAQELCSGDYAFVAVAYPAPQGAECPVVQNITKSCENGALKVSFQADGTQYELELKENRLHIIS